MINPRTAIERHFAWMKRYSGLKYFQAYILIRVTQFVTLTYIAALAVALTVEVINALNCIALVRWFWRTYEVIKFPNALNSH